MQAPLRRCARPRALAGQSRAVRREVIRPTSVPAIAMLCRGEAGRRSCRALAADRADAIRPGARRTTKSSAAPVATPAAASGRHLDAVAGSGHRWRGPDTQIAVSGRV